MAELNLIPNPTLLVVQSTVFLANVWIVNSFILKPYQKLKESREKLTTGRQDESKAVRVEIASRLDAMKQQTSAAFEQARQMLSSAREQAAARQAEILSVAHTEAEATLNQFRSALKSNLDQERAKAPQVVNELAGEVFKKLLN
jgi:F0F1-type ATP synthase membrane subunit b/b'